MSFNSFSSFTSLPGKTASSAPVAGFPVGALSQVCGSSGSGKTEVVLRYLAENPALRVAWVEESFNVYPCAFPLNQVSLDRIFFVDAAKDALWVTHQILQSQIFGVVVVSAAVPEKDAAVTLRRLQLLAEKSRTSVILLSETPIRSASWAIRLQLEVTRAVEGGELSLKILKRKGDFAWQHHSA